MSKTEEKKRLAAVESAIRSLYERFPDVDVRSSYDCENVFTKTISALRRKIKKREKELENDAQLKGLRRSYKEEVAKVVLAAQEQHRRVDDLLRTFQVRGMSPDLLDEIERMAKEEPAYVRYLQRLDPDDE